MLTQRVHQCEFCGASFHPRHQVKNPRACMRAECQKKRQRSNELEWRQNNAAVSDPQYHHICKLARLKRLRQISELLGRCIRTGAAFLNEKFLFESMQEVLLQFLLELGIRKVNKFWPNAFTQGEHDVT
jgi:hypothetical protein